MRKLSVLTVLVLVMLVTGSWKSPTTSANLDILSTFQASFAFQPNHFQLSIPGDIHSSLFIIPEVLENKEATKVCITGFFDEAEKNYTNFEDLGFARAENIKENLMFWGIPSHKIELNSASLSEQDKPLSVAVNLFESKKIKPSFYNPLNLYYKANKYKIKLTSPIKDYVKGLVDFLEENPETKVYITGHSYEGDNTEWNERVSRYRASEVEKVFLEYGVPEDRIEVTYKGKSELMIDGDDIPKSEINKNRRVEVRVK